MWNEIDFLKYKSLLYERKHTDKEMEFYRINNEIGNLTIQLNELKKQYNVTEVRILKKQIKELQRQSTKLYKELPKTKEQLLDAIIEDLESRLSKAKKLKEKF